MASDASYQQLDIQGRSGNRCGRGMWTTKTKVLAVSLGVVIAAVIGVSAFYAHRTFIANPDNDYQRDRPDDLITCNTDKDCTDKKGAPGYICDFERGNAESEGVCVKDTRCHKPEDCPDGQDCLRDSESGGTCVDKPVIVPNATHEDGGGPLAVLPWIKVQKLIFEQQQDVDELEGTRCGVAHSARARRAPSAQGLLSDSGCPIDGDCDKPSVRDSYNADTAVRNLKVMFHLMRRPNGSLPITTTDMSAQIATLNQNYAPANFKFTGAYKSYTNDDLASAIVAHGGGACDIANEFLDDTASNVAVWQRMLRPCSQLVGPNRVQWIRLSKGDTWSAVVKSTNQSPFYACLVRCPDAGNCTSYWPVQCAQQGAPAFEWNAAGVLPQAGYYAIAVANNNTIQNAYFNISIGWKRVKSCVDPITWATSLSPSFGTDQPFQVFVSDFAPDLSASGYPAVLLNGFGHFPWWEARTTGLLFMNPTRIGAGKQTLGHEIGHCIGLWHTFHGVSEVDSDCDVCAEHPKQDAATRDTNGDFCSDTMPFPRQWDCFDPSGRDTCTNDPWFNTPFNNLMSYGSDTCRTKLTQQQISRSRCWMLHAMKPFY